MTRARATARSKGEPARGGGRARPGPLPRQRPHPVGAPLRRGAPTGFPSRDRAAAVRAAAWATPATASGRLRAVAGLKADQGGLQDPRAVRHPRRTASSGSRRRRGPSHHRLGQVGQIAHVVHPTAEGNPTTGVAQERIHAGEVTFAPPAAAGRQRRADARGAACPAAGRAGEHGRAGHSKSLLIARLQVRGPPGSPLGHPQHRTRHPRRSTPSSRRAFHRTSEFRRTRPETIRRCRTIERMATTKLPVPGHRQRPSARALVAQLDRARAF
jgi:hypothetical protein